LPSPKEIALATRRLFEAKAGEERALIVVLDDLHWAETTFLDLLEHVADFARDAPIHLLCVARPELLELRPTWGGGKMNATSLLLEPLPEAEANELIASPCGRIQLGRQTRRRIAQASEGNPLFVEEMLAMMREVGGPGSEVSIPPSIHALLEARLDSLDAGERSGR